MSRVLGGVGYVSEKSRESVEKAIQRLDYTPLQVARSLRKQRSPIIGLIVTDIKNPYYPELVRRHLNKLNAFGKNVVSVDLNTNETNFPVIGSDGHEGGVLVGKRDGSPRYSGLIDRCAGIPTHYFSVGYDDISIASYPTMELQSARRFPRN